MLEAAWKVYNNREKEERRIRENRLLAVMTGTADRGRGRGKGRGISGREGFRNFSNRNFNTPLGVNQCALCREEGHWKRDCPRNEQCSGQNIQKEVARMMVLDE